MLHTNFTSNGIRYQLLTVGRSFREKEALAENIQPDTSLWTNAYKKKLMGEVTVEKIAQAHKDRRHRFRLPKAKREY